MCMVGLVPINSTKTTKYMLTKTEYAIFAEKVLAVAAKAGWELDNSPATEMCDDNWYRFDNCTPIMHEDDLVHKFAHFVG